MLRSHDKDQHKEAPAPSRKHEVGADFSGIDEHDSVGAPGMTPGELLPPYEREPQPEKRAPLPVSVVNAAPTVGAPSWQAGQMPVGGVGADGTVQVVGRQLSRRKITIRNTAAVGAGAPVVGLAPVREGAGTSSCFIIGPGEEYNGEHSAPVYAFIASGVGPAVLAWHAVFGDE